MTNQHDFPTLHRITPLHVNSCARGPGRIRHVSQFNEVSWILERITMVEPGLARRASAHVTQASVYVRPGEYRSGAGVGQHAGRGPARTRRQLTTGSRSRSQKRQQRSPVAAPASESRAYLTGAMYLLMVQYKC